jgi:hypothetical protein
MGWKKVASVDLKKIGRLAASVYDMIVEKTGNVATTMIVLKMALAMSEANLRHAGIKVNMREIDAFISKFIKNFEKHLPSR